MRTVRTLTLALFTIALSLPIQAFQAAQSPVTAADLSRLENTAADIGRQVTALRKTDATLANDVDRTLGDLNDEITYLRVKMRKDGSVTREEYTALRDRLETLRVKAQGQKVSVAPVPDDPPLGSGVLPVGTEFDVRLQTPLNSGTARVEQRFEATTIADVSQGGKVLIPAGAIVRGFVSSVRPAGRIDRKGSITLSFDEIRFIGRSQRLRASVVQALDGKIAEDATRIGAGAMVGAMLGGILGGGKGALLGVLVGGGGTIAATEGTDVQLPAGTVLRIRLDEPLEIKN